MTANTQKIIMRRVYYSYFLSLLNGAFFQGAVLSSSVLLFGQLTHVAAIYNNILAVPVGQLPGYVFRAFGNAATHGELLTVLVTLLILMLGGSLAFRVYNFNPQRMRIA